MERAGPDNQHDTTRSALHKRDTGKHSDGSTGQAGEHTMTIRAEGRARALWDKYHGTYQDAKKNGRRDEEQAAAEVCRVIEYILS